MIRSLITGGAGFIGFHLAKHLHEQGQEVTVVDNLSRGRMDEEFKGFIDKPNVKFIQCDLTDQQQVNNLGEKYDYVYHLAAINGTKYFYEIPDKVLKVNTLASIYILEWFMKSGSKKILFSSSSETYAGTMRRYGIPIPTPENVPLCVEDVKNARWSYGGSKIIGELFFINYARVHKFRMSIIRYHNIYGPRMGFEHVMPEFALRLNKKENPFKIFGGKETRAFCYVKDACRATQMVMESDKTDDEIVHIGNDTEEITMIDMAKKMFKIAGFEPKLDIKEAPAGCVQRRCPDISKLRSLTGFMPETNLDHGLRSLYDWYKDKEVQK